MTNEKMLEEIRKGKKRFSPELIESLVEFYDEFDPYGVLDEYGDISVKYRRKRMKRDLRYMLRKEPEYIINDITYSIEDNRRFEEETKQFEKGI